MFELTLALLSVVIAVVLPGAVNRYYAKQGREAPPLMPKIASAAGILLALFMIASTSWVVIDQNQIGHLKRKYFAEALPTGHIIARGGQLGPQADILGPGLTISPLIRVLYDIEEIPVLNVPEGKYAMLTAKDGAPLRSGQFIADEWGDEINRLLDANHFLGYMEEQGRPLGQKGPQLTVLPPGQYRFNHYLFDAQIMDALTVQTGHVAVVRSNVKTIKEECPDVLSDATKDAGAGKISQPVVPMGCVGVWDRPLMPGRYYLNQKAYQPTIIPTRVQTWTYQGGYTARKINLTVGDDGKITQVEESLAEDLVKFDPARHADKAITVRAQGWTFPVELRAVVQVDPNDAPHVVAAVGTLEQVENRIVTPAIRDVLRTIGGRKDHPCVKGSADCECSTLGGEAMCVIPGTRVLDFIEERDRIAAQVLQAVVPEGRKAGVTITDVRLGEAAIPPELLVARLRKQLAEQLEATYVEEEKAQQQRIEVERKRATADQQRTLVQAEIASQAADHYKAKRKKEGEGERDYLLELAKGQEKQANVLGKDRVMQLQITKMSLEAAKENPSIVKVPMFMNSGDSSGLVSAFGVLGASNIARQIMRGGGSWESAQEGAAK